MSLQQIFQSFTERLQTSASVNAVYGEPIEAHGRTVIPVAKVSFGFGGGFGAGGANQETRNGPGGEGGGGGGGATVQPLGVVEISESGTRYIPVDEKRRLIGAVTTGIGIGLWIARKRLRR
jgi:uncharacterized spore protein YtfJ